MRQKLTTTFIIGASFALAHLAYASWIFQNMLRENIIMAGAVIVFTAMCFAMLHLIVAKVGSEMRAPTTRYVLNITLWAIATAIGLSLGGAALLITTSAGTEFTAVVESSPAGFAVYVAVSVVISLANLAINSLTAKNKPA
ncbi:MAG: hypothetical protein JST49_05935 [Bacteroidetes bacterium]|nr:hypothetical protein [Bacteroidota bacterium]